MLIRQPERGFSLIELLVVVAVIALLAMLAAPSMRMYIENSKILGAAELLYASAQQARTEAIRRSVPVEVVFTDAAPSSASVDTTAVNTSGPNWLVRQTPLPGTDDHIFIEARAGAEGGGRAGGTSMVLASSASSIRFNAAGALVGGGAATVDLSSDVAACAPSGDARCLRVVVSSGGQVRLCDPAVAAANDTRRC